MRLYGHTMLLVVLGAAFLTGELAAAPNKSIPIKAWIVPFQSESRTSDNPLGNVNVQFSDGHSEMWTRKGGCYKPEVSATGLVGWIRVSTVDDSGRPIYPSIRVCWTDGHFKDFVGTLGDGLPYIDAWGFAENNQAIVIKTRRAHGVAHYVKVSLNDGNILGTGDLSSGPLPSWTSSYSD